MRLAFFLVMEPACTNSSHTPMRGADSRGDVETPVQAFRCLIRPLPTVLKRPWFFECRPMLVQQIEALHTRRWFTTILFDIDGEVIGRQIADQRFEHRREQWPRDPVTGRFIDQEYRILGAEIIPGAELRRRELAREARVQRRDARSPCADVHLPSQIRIRHRIDLPTKKPRLPQRSDSWLFSY